FGRHVRQRMIEAFEYDLLDVVLRQCRNLVAQAADLSRYQFRTLSAPCKIRARMRLEGHDRRGQTVLLGELADTRQDGLMAAMDAVEIAYRDGAGALAIVAGKGAIKSRIDFHTREFTILCCLN